MSGDATGSQTVNESGESYSFAVNPGGNYTITPSKTGYTFSPYSQSFANVTSTQIQHFAGEIIGNNISFVSIPGGTFPMGQTGVATPVHNVTVSAFEMGKFEVTQGQYKAVTGTNPSYSPWDDTMPVENVSWWDAIKFCNALSKKEGLPECYNVSTGECDFTRKGYRLPTEAEWEYACRAGTTTLYNLGDMENDLGRAGWYYYNSGYALKPVGQKIPNAWGLYDMHGNVFEWCND